MKLKKLLSILKTAQEYAEGLNPNVEIWLGEEELIIKHIGQFSVVPDVAIEVKKKRKKKV